MVPEKKQRKKAIRMQSAISEHAGDGERDHLNHHTHADDDGWVDLSELGDNLPKRVPGFDPRNYKCTKLKQFIERFDSVEVRSARNPHNKILSITMCA